VQAAGGSSPTKRNKDAREGGPTKLGFQATRLDLGGFAVVWCQADHFSKNGRSARVAERLVLSTQRITPFQRGSKSSNVWSSASIFRYHPSLGGGFFMTSATILLDDGTLQEKDSFLLFVKDAEFSSPSAAAAVVHGGGANGLTEWKTTDGTTLKEMDERT
jgi:hypothetical protein